MLESLYVLKSCHSWDGLRNPCLVTRDVGYGAPDMLFAPVATCPAETDPRSVVCSHLYINTIPFDAHEQRS